MGGISIWQLLIVLAIVVLLFGTKKLKNLGSDLGGAVKGFRSAMDNEDSKANVEHEQQGQTFDAQVQNKEEEPAAKS